MKALLPHDKDDVIPTPEEVEIVSRAREGDRDAFRLLVEQHQDRVFRVAMRVLRCDRHVAEDICQEVFFRAYRGLQGFDGAVRFGIWLHTIAMNTSISEYRKRRTLKRNRLTLSIDAPIAGTDDLTIEPPSRERRPEERADHREFATAVRAAVAELPDEFREAVMLRDMQGKSYEEIAEILDVPAGTVRSRIHRGRLQLQEKLREFKP